MADTLAADMIVPDVWADMVQAEFTGNMVLGDLALQDNILEGKPGDTVHFPKFATLTDADVLTEAVAMVPEKLTTTDETATISEAGKAVEISDTALLTGFGDPLGEIRRQLGIVVARRIDTSLRAEAEVAGAYTSSVGAAISADAVADMLGEFGDNSDPTDFAGLIIHSKQKTDLFKDDDFTRQDSYGPGNVLARGQIGDIFGIPVIVSDRVTVTAGALDTYGAILVKRGALGLLYKRRPVVESDRDILRRTTVLTTNVHYAVKRLNDQGVGVLTTQ